MDHLFFRLFLDGAQHDFSDPKKAHGNGEKFHALPESRKAEGEPGCTEQLVRTDRGKCKSQKKHDHILDERAVAQADEKKQANRSDREEFRRPELYGGIGEHAGRKHEANDRKRASHKRSNSRDGKGGSPTSLLRHLVTVYAGNDRGGFAGDIEENRSRR